MLPKYRIHREIRSFGYVPKTSAPGRFMSFCRLYAGIINRLYSPMMKTTVTIKRLQQKANIFFTT